MRQNLTNLLPWNRCALLDFGRKVVRALDRLDGWKAEVFLVIGATVAAASIVSSSYRVFCSN